MSDSEVLEGSEAPFAPSVDWWEMDPADRVDTLGELRIFVARLVTAYGHQMTGAIPACWEQHEGAVRLLDALHRSYLVATHPAQVGEALIGWHHNLTYIRGELQTLFGMEACTDDHHAPMSVPQWAADIDADGKESQTWQARQAEALAAYEREVAARAGA